LVFVGRPERAKGIDIALEVMLAIKHADLLVLGESSERETWEALARERGLSSRVHFEGEVSVDRVARTLAQADLLLFPSRSDPWGLVVNEAQAAGCPVVMSPTPGAADDLATGGAAHVVELDIQQWVNEVQALLDDPARRERMRAAGRDLALRFSPEACARGLAQVCR